MSSRRFLYLCLVLAILLSGMVTPPFQPAAVLAASPETPGNVSPADGATGVTLTPTLQSSAFSDPDARHSHWASQWQIRASSGDYFSRVFDSGWDRSNLTSIVVPSGILHSSTTYYWHVRYQDDHRARSVWSEETSFTTVLSSSDRNAPATVTDLAAAAATANSATLSWTAPGDDGSTGTASIYDLRYFTASLTDTNWGSASQCSGEPTPNAAGSAETFTVTGLSPDTTYYFAMKTADEVPNWSGLSNVASKKTNTLPPMVATSAATSVGATSATLNGNLTSLGTATSVQISFQWGTSSSYGSDTSAQSISATGAFSANLTGLNANTKYHFRTKAAGHGSAVYGEDRTFTTASLPDTAALVISLLNASEITTSGATIIWTTNEAASSQIQYGLTEEYSSSFVDDWNLATSHSVDVNDLKAGKTYHYRVISKDAAGKVAVSRDATFTTTARSGGMPTWAWVLIGLAMFGVAGAVAFLIKGRLAKQ